MSRIFAGILLITIGFRTTGYVAFALVRLHGVRVEARNRPPGHRRSTACHFTFSKSEFRQLANGKREFWHAGRLYDIERLRQQGDSLHIVGRPDDSEQHLLAGLKTFFQRSNQSGQDSRVALWWAQFLTQPFLPPAGCTGFRLPPGRLNRQPGFPPQLAPASLSPGILTPPPRRCARM